jgi:DNA-binding HxlR family transcriptional regulator
VTAISEIRCSIARTLDIVGDRWALMVLRDIHSGITRFDAIQANLGLSRKVLAQRLAELTEQGVIERRPYSEHPPRFDYVLTQKGSELGVVLLAMIAWGDRWTDDGGGPPALLRHTACGQHTAAVPTCAACGEVLLPDAIAIEPQPVPARQSTDLC